MKAKTKQLLTLLMAGLLSISVPFTTYASTSAKNSLVNVIVSESDEQTIIAQVPKEYVDEYKEKLKDPVFKQEQINMMSGNNSDLSEGKIVAQSLPEGKMIAQRYLYRSDIKRIYESATAPNALENLILNFGPSAAVSKIIATLGLGSPWGLVGALGTWAVEYIRVKPEDWWTQSYIMILEKSISCVRVSHIQNLKPTYPAAWLILERL
ncbi:hypothetical protein SDC9_39538 [bioreactor metagenome]|jgi:hypothetical protein|uniref:Uncharacterized protein n=2 Tax=root TaxID=1 RepID=R9CC01_9CLOT|nr:hypothetical protein [Clostridium sartagoforme]EOR26565.1 hypothetical protein A500_07626 [Clostridium sartagoforme AAU1]